MRDWRDRCCYVHERVTFLRKGRLVTGIIKRATSESVTVEIEATANGESLAGEVTLTNPELFVVMTSW